MIYAGFWRRLCAHFIDGSLIGLMLSLVLIIPIMSLGIAEGIEQAKERKHHRAHPTVIQKVTPMANEYTTEYPANPPAPIQASPTPPVATPAPTVQSPIVNPDEDADSEPFMPHQSITGEEDESKDRAGAAAMGALLLLFYPLMFVVSAIYHTLFVASRWQATPGKRVMGCMVVTEDGKRLRKLHAFGRHLACAISGMTFSIGYLLIGWTKEKTGLHDLIADTRVVRYKNSIPVAAASISEI